MKKILLILFASAFIFYGCEKEPSPSEQVITRLEALETSLPADGKSYTYIIAEIPSDAVDTYNKITITTSAGKLNDGEPKSISVDILNVTINDTLHKRAIVKLTSAIVPSDSVRITASIANYQREILIKFEKPQNPVISLDIETPTILADGYTYTNVTVNVNADSAAKFGNKITLNTTSGTFEGTTGVDVPVYTSITNNSIKQAVVRLKSGVEVKDNVAVTASTTAGLPSGLYSDKKYMQFTYAAPESLRVTSPDITFKKGFNNVKPLTINTYRYNGKPSKGTVVDLSIVDLNNNPRGFLINYNNKTDENGIITNSFTLGNDTLLDYSVLKVIATTQGLAPYILTIYKQP